MTNEGFARKISAILSADASGYSRLMGENEEETVRTIKAYREATAILINEHRGRLVDSPGDNLLAEFASVVDALRCAWDIQLWAEKYDRDLKDIFKLQDEITLKIVTSLQVKLTEGEQAAIVAGGTDKLDAFIKFLQGVEYVKRVNPEGILLGRKLAEEIIALDPNYPRGYRMLATTHSLAPIVGVSKSPKESFKKAASLYQKVIAMDPSDAVANAFLGMVYVSMRRHEKGLAEAEKAIAINSNAADAHAIFSNILHFSGRHREAIEAGKKAMRLNPFPPNWYFMYLGHAYFHAGRYEEAIAEYKKSLRIKPDNLFVHARLAAAYCLLGSEEKAQKEAAEVLRIDPYFSVDHISQPGGKYKYDVDRKRLRDSLLKAGLPEQSLMPANMRR